MDTNIILITALAVVLLVGLPIAFVVGRLALKSRNVNAQANSGGSTGNTSATQSKGSLGKWLLWLFIALLLLTVGIFIAQLVDWTVMPSWISDLAPFLVTGAIIAVLFIAGISLMNSGKKGAGLLLGLSLLLLGGTVLVYWLGAENVLKAGRNGGEALANGTPAEVRVQTNCPQGFCSLAPDGFPIVEGARQRQPFVITRGEAVTFHTIGEVAIRNYPNFCLNVPSTYLQHWSPDGLVYYIRPRSGNEGTVTVTSKHDTYCNN